MKLLISILKVYAKEANFNANLKQKLNSRIKLFEKVFKSKV